MLPCLPPFPRNLFSLPEGFPLTHTVWWEFLQLHTFLPFGVFSAVSIATHKPPSGRKQETCTYLLLPLWVSGGSVQPGSAGPRPVSVVS